MPLDGAMVATPPAGTTAVPNTVVASAPYNALKDDIYNIFNTKVQPVIGGGTGSTTARGAIDALSAQGAAVTSAATTNIGAAATGNSLHVTGTTTITSFGPNTAGMIRFLTFDSALTLTHNAASLILPGGANIRTAAGDTAIAVGEGGANWRIENYVRANGLGIVASLVTGISTTVALTLAERGNVVSANATAGTVTINLPAAATAGNGFPLVIKKSDATANTVVIDPSGAETIDGATTRTIRMQYQSVAIVCDGSSWFTINEGSIFDSGTNAGGDYIRYANGWATCTKTITPGLATATASGSIFISGGIAGGTLPITFASTPVVTASGTNSSGNGWTLLTVIPTTTTWGTYRHASAVTDASTGGILYLTAVGKWF